MVLVKPSLKELCQPLADMAFISIYEKYIQTDAAINSGTLEYAINSKATSLALTAVFIAKMAAQAELGSPFPSISQAMC